ncbi:MAG: dTMP kinase [Alphaproteobacteria bacterium]|nr:MAG: dTMP kinase [Alphaproteobacteria bacterium]
MQRGKFITLEGGEGTGKSSQAARLAERLTAAGRTIVRTREPGGSPGAEAIRSLVVSGDGDAWSPRTELLLMYAARSDHLERVIKPALERGDWVICDRFADSSRAYQGVGGGIEQGFIEMLDAVVVADDQPDLTLVFDLPVETGLERAMGRGAAETRFESKGLAFHQRLREGFQAIAAMHPERCAVIDATGSVDQVAERIWAVIEGRLT